MKKIVVFVTIIINLFAVNGSVGIISGVQEETYIDHNKYFIFPSWSLKYRYFSINGMNISTSFPYKGIMFNFSFEPNLIGETLEKGDLDGKILEDRDSPMILSLKATKRFKKSSFNMDYKRDFSSDGNIFTAGAAYTYFFDKKYDFVIIPSIQYSYADKNYSNYFLNFTANESLLMGDVFENLNDTNTVDIGVATNIVLTPKTSLLFAYKLKYLDENKIIKKEDVYYNSFIAGFNYKF